MMRLGVSDDSYVVVYDRSFTAWATRVWWMLRWIGFDNAKVLDGGFGAWEAAGLPVEADADAGDLSSSDASLSLNLRAEAMAAQSEVRQCIDDPGAALIDTLPLTSFDGSEPAYRRAGHIPGVRHSFALSMFQEDGTFKAKDELAALLGDGHNQKQVTYRGAGILASATAFAMVQLGFKDVALYAASLKEWVQVRRSRGDRQSTPSSP